MFRPIMFKDKFITEITKAILSILLVISIFTYLILQIKSNPKNFSITCYSGERIFFADTAKAVVHIRNGVYHYIKNEDNEKLEVTISGNCLLTERE